MGARNVAAVFARHGALNDLPFRLLTFMAFTALDDDKPPRFWGGRADLAHAIGRALPAEPSEGDMTDDAVEARRVRKATLNAISRGLAQLVSANVVSVAVAARGGRRAEYHLHLLAGQHHADRGADAEKEDHADRGADGIEDHADRGAPDHADRGAQHHADRVTAPRSAWSQHHADRGPKEDTGESRSTRGEDRLRRQPTAARIDGELKCLAGHRFAKFTDDGECIVCLDDLAGRPSLQEAVG